MFGSRISRLKSGEYRKNKAPVRWLSRQQRKYDLEKSYLADKTSSDDDSMFSIPVKTISKAKSGYKKKAPVRWSSQQEKKKYDLEKSYLADQMNSDDDSMVSIAEKTRIKAKFGYKEKAPVRWSSQQEKKKYDLEKRVYPADEMNSDFVAARTRSREKAPVKRTIFNRDPRLGAAKRALEEDILRNTPELDPDSDDDSDDEYRLEDVFHKGFKSGFNYADMLAELNDYCRNELPERTKAWKEQYRAQLKDHDLNEKEILGESDYTLASQAVKFYNHKHSTNYVLEETLGSYSGEFDDGFWAHCNFRAQNTTAGRRPVSRLFFAELFGYLHEYEVDSCVTLDGPGRCRDVVHGCEICPKWVRHPVNEFKNGHPDEYTAV